MQPESTWDPCPGSALVTSPTNVNGVVGFYQHVHPVTCDVCGLPGRARWWTATYRHLCRTCMGKGL